ncbi:MAG: 50S ribosomal protein L35ae [Candidatus Micrarchaeota archaeon]|nr:50S ribosomal protein L35ae [Candidatus Micrarchaeota archaeon]
MKAVVVNFCGGKTSKKGNHVILDVGSVDTKEKAAKLVGKNVIWKTPSGKVISGKITKAHGNSGAVKAIMEKGLPGTVLGKEITIEG